jgi:ribonuclease D
MDLLTTTDSLAAAAKALAKTKYVTVDTEFIRDTTYWPELCLVQIAGPEDVYLVDPLAKNIDLAPLIELLTAKKVVKVMHAARQDIEIFHHKAGIIPEPLFDTQVAAMVCGFGDSVGYEALVKRFVNASIDKSSRFTDWRRRPLSEEQVHYAVADVTHLRFVYEALAEKIAQSGRESWVSEEMAVLNDPATYSLAPEEAWKRIKPKSMNRKALSVLMEVAAWREREAQARNVPRARIIKDDALVEIALQAPESREALGRLRALPSGFGNSRAAKPVLEAVARGVARPKDEVPLLPRPRIVPQGAGPLMELLKVLLKMKCEAHGVAQKLVATTADLEIIAADETPDVPALNGWRRDVFGADALALKRGEIGLGVRGGELAVLPIQGGQAEWPQSRSRKRSSHGAS